MNKNILIWIVVIVCVAFTVYFIASNKSKVPETPANENVAINTETPSAPAVKEFTVEAKNFAFVPSIINVKKGDRVKITFKNTQGFHDFKIDEYSVAAAQTKSPAEEVLEFTADKVGTFEYYCSVGSHRAMGMKGTLKVE